MLSVSHLQGSAAERLSYKVGSVWNLKTFRPLQPECESQMISILNFPRELLVPPLG